MAEQSSFRWDALAFVLAQIALAAVTWAALEIGANAATAGFAYLLMILGIAVLTRLATSIVSSLVATLCYNYFFFHPTGTLRIDDAANWVALVSFLTTSLVATQLVVRARRQAEEAEDRRRELENLYALSVELFAATRHVGALADATKRALANAGAAGGGLVMFGGDVWDQNVVAWEGPRDEELDNLIAGVGRHDHPLVLPAQHGRDVYLPLKLGGAVAGVLCVRQTRAALPALESAATLVALAVERERLLAEAAHVRALQEGDALKTSLLRAVSHDLATPLTAMGLQIERLQALVHGPAADVAEAVAEHAGRLRRRIENLLAMARLEAGVIVPRPEPTPAADLFRSVTEHLPSISHHRPIEIRVDADCPEVFVDPSLALEILANLIENAHQAAPGGSLLELVASRHPLDPRRVRLQIADRGPGLRFGPLPDASDTPRRGLGFDIARGLTVASGGEVTLTDRPGGGAVAQLDLPAAQLAPLDGVVA